MGALSVHYVRIVRLDIRGPRVISFYFFLLGDVVGKVVMHVRVPSVEVSFFVVVVLLMVHHLPMLRFLSKDPLSMRCTLCTTTIYNRELHRPPFVVYVMLS
jgi:hypothetical protein